MRKIWGARLMVIGGKSFMPVEGVGCTAANFIAKAKGAVLRKEDGSFAFVLLIHLTQKKN